MKAILVALWVMVVALGSTYGASVYWPARVRAGAAGAVAVFQHQKTRALNVPLIAHGAVQGVMTLQFDVAMDAALLRGVPVPPDIALLDEAFRTIYADTTIDTGDLKAYDLPAFTRHLVTATNAKLGVPVITDVLVVDFSFLPRTKVAPP